jgi:hypothetical protein
MKFLNRLAQLFRRHEVTDNDTAAKHDGALLAFVALNQDWLASADVLEERLKDFLQPNPGFAGFEPSDGTVTFAVRERICAVGLMPAPIPWSDLEEMCATCWMWPEAAEKMRDHKAHLLVTLFGPPLGRVDGAVTLTKVVAAMVEAHDTAGVYWGDGTLVIKPEMFVEVAQTATTEDPPIPIWVEHRIQRNPDASLNVITTGLAPFGCMEIEVINSKRTPEDLLNIIAGVSHLQLRGDVFKDGDTVGFDAVTKIKTFHRKSVWDRPEKVLRLDY